LSMVFKIPPFMVLKTPPLVVKKELLKLLIKQLSVDLSGLEKSRMTL